MPLTLRTRTTTTERQEISAMKFVLRFHGTHGDVKPGVAVGRELLRRGHEVRPAVPAGLAGFIESVVLAAVAYEPDCGGGRMCTATSSPN